MEAKSLLQGRSPLATQFARQREIRKPKYRSPPSIITMLARPTKSSDNVDTSIISTTLNKTTYNDNWFDHLSINYVSQALQNTSGLKNNKSGYGSFVEVATAIYQSVNTSQQQQLIIQALEKAFPKPILSLIRLLMPQSKFSREYFAVFTTIFFPWLVGPCEVRESEFDGRREKNVVHIKKCRVLEETNCVGICTNLCKMPSQAFIKDSLGVPVNMVPNFDDMSCEMIFGQDPPAQNDDPAFKQPCYKLCTAKQKHKAKCIS